MPSHGGKQPKQHGASAPSARSGGERSALPAAPHGIGGEYGAVASPGDAGKWLSQVASWLERSEATEPANLLTAWLGEFKPRKLKAPVVLAWLLFQALGLVYQVALYMEVSQHLQDFEFTLEAFCGESHQQHGICLGPSWNLTYTGMLSFPPQPGGGRDPDFDFVIVADQTFSFRTSSHPPTFLIGVEPQPPHKHLSWKATVHGKRLAGYGGQCAQDTTYLHGSADAYAVHVAGASYANRWWSRRSPPPPPRKPSCRSQPEPVAACCAVQWSGSLSLTGSRARETGAEVLVYAVDSRIQHLEDIHAQPQCSFELSWQNFNERHSGRHHTVLTWTSQLTFFFVAVQLFAVSLVLHRFLNTVESGKLLSRVIALKFVLQDWPQQLCVGAYIYAWYADNGLRCQMCLFHPEHCDEQHPLHWNNLMLCLFTLLSACSNQMLVQAKVKRHRLDEEEECMLCVARTAMLSVSALPSSASLLLLSHHVLHLQHEIWYFVAWVPTAVGSLALICLPVVALCDEDL